MYQEEDYLIRQIHHLIALIVQLVLGERGEAEVDDQLQGTFGLSLRTLDALPASALLGLYDLGDPRDRARLDGLISVLDALSTHGPNAQIRKEKADALRSAAARPR